MMLAFMVYGFSVSSLFILAGLLMMFIGYIGQVFIERTVKHVFWHWLITIGALVFFVSVAVILWDASPATSTAKP